ncbi:hypothetical protein SAMN05443245_0928 [Paraburkholderia fungorum]|uniref:Uncharacterized protein n=1 Tax=Paraburkholderia fungorum TaxID=134537 RepID=A0A1H0ZZ58_9BURK|nr:hypothetical protein [Paraburkholderia fungorum]SDQ32670.1 hypothetical protein SAMN05443245_0928 [Paraburkholderia fungorum]
MNRENRYLFPLLIFVCALLLLWYRAPTRIEHGYLWAEDAAIFITQAYDAGRHSFFLSYSGYWHFVPRLVAWLQMRTTPLTAAPYFFVWACVLITALTSAYIAYAFRRFSRPVAGLFALAPLLVPQTGECLLNVTNIQWILFPALLVLLWENLFNPPESGYIIRGLAAAAISLTGPFGIIALGPVTIAGAYALRSGRLSRRQFGFFLLYLLGVLGQIYAVKTSAAPPLEFGARPYLLRYSARLLREVFTDLLPLPDSVPTIAGLILAIPLVFVVARSRARGTCLLLASMAGLIWLLGAGRSNPYLDHMMWYGFGARYIYPALMFFFWAALLSFETATSTTSRYVAGGLIVVILLSSAARFQAQEWPRTEITRSSTGYVMKVAPNWTAQIPDRH